jgi:D-alanyl-D-alanine carboxypeptidase
VEATPPNLHDEICGPHRKKPPADDEEDQAEGSADEPNGSFSTLLSALRAPARKGASLLSDQGIAVPPVVVYTGPTRNQSELAHLAAEPVAGHHKKKGTGKTAAAKPTGQSVADGKGAGKKAGAATPWTPMSSSALAGSPPPELGTKAAAAPPKKRHKAKQAAK